MEYRLLFIGLAMGAFAGLSRRWHRGDGLKSPTASALWHAVFIFLTGFSIAILFAISFDIRDKFVTLGPCVIPVMEFSTALLIGGALGAVGFWRARADGGDAEGGRLLLHEDMEWADTVFSAALMASLLTMFVVQAFRIPSASMEKTLLVGDHLFVNKFLYGLRVPLTGRRVRPLRQPRRGDILVFQFPADAPPSRHCGSEEYGKDLIKRLIGEPGDTVEVRAGRVILNGKPLGDERPYAVYDAASAQAVSPRARELSPEQYQALWEDRRLDDELNNSQRDFFGPVTVPSGAYFMMGDNRDHSCDSRYWGPVPETYVKGNAWFLYWPPSRMGAVR